MKTQVIENLTSVPESVEGKARRFDKLSDRQAQRPTSSGFKVKMNDSLYQSVYGVKISFIFSLRYVFQYVMKSL